jgi:hypothetical protein
MIITTFCSTITEPGNPWNCEFKISEKKTLAGIVVGGAESFVTGSLFGVPRPVVSTKLRDLSITNTSTLPTTTPHHNTSPENETTPL